MKITFIGGGNMARALISGLTANGVPAGEISVVEPDADKRAELSSMYGVKAYDAANGDALQCDAIVLAVKPQQLAKVASGIAPMISGQLVISIAAGILEKDLSNWLGGHERIVRVMPNTPAQVMMGVSALHAMEGVDEAGRWAAEKILSAVGETIWLEQEEKMDAFTALCGSGPAYVFYFLEAMADAAVEMGFDREQAKSMAIGTFAGSVKLAAESGEDAATLRMKITSKGGTTEKAILSMESDGVKRKIVDAIRAAEARSRELGIELGRASC
ncbi:MAG: pyrroline-5-carboxylate reductase [Burkholderiales bacterium]|nr:pyrroline-5-carboxylate reductase [Burkholderiales bacterium]